MSVSNITHPSRRQNEDCRPRLLVLKVTDGHTKALAIESEAIPSISANCSPGAKIRLLGDIVVQHGKILLNPSNFEFLGGEVDHLLEAWKANLNAQRVRKLGFKVAANESGEGPPKFELKLEDSKSSKSVGPKINNDMKKTKAEAGNISKTKNVDNSEQKFKQFSALSSDASAKASSDTTKSKSHEYHAKSQETRPNLSKNEPRDQGESIKKDNSYSKQGL